MDKNKYLTYEESIKRLEIDLKENLVRKDFTMAGFMDIENLQECVKQNKQLKEKLDNVKKFINTFHWTIDIADKDTVFYLKDEFWISEFLQIIESES